jgi:hypothetical protein
MKPQSAEDPSFPPQTTEFRRTLLCLADHIANLLLGLMVEQQHVVLARHGMAESFA